MKYSSDQVNAFYTADQHMRNSIRQDVLAERYADLQQELNDLENLLNISEQENDEAMFDITDMLFELLEQVVPELVGENGIDGVINEEIDADTRRHARAQLIRQREQASIDIMENSEDLVRAKSNIRTARLGLKGAKSSDAKKVVRKSLRAARQHLSSAAIKKAEETKED